MEKSIEKYLNQNNILNKNTPIMLGFSGGNDSMCLLHILHKLQKIYKFELIALHLNHNWRGEEALSEQKKCQAFCNNLDIKFYTETLPKYSKCSELEAREARYNFFEKCSNIFNSNILLTAHTKTDNAETLIYRIIKGTGLQGLKGIPTVRKTKHYNIYRPLLVFSRQDIENYNKQNNLSPNNDSSNENTIYARNFIRKEIFPSCIKLNNNVENAINNLSLLAHQQHNIVEEYINIIKKDLFDDKKIITEKFLALSKDVQEYIIFELIKNTKDSYDFNLIKFIIEFINQNKHHKTPKIFALNSNLFICISNKYIHTQTKNENNLSPLLINKEGCYEYNNYTLLIEKYSNQSYSFNSAQDLEFFVDLSNIKFPLEFRQRNTQSKNADFIQPFGMKGSMKLKKYLINKHICKITRDHLLLLSKDNEILWVAGIGISEKLRITNKPTHKIKLIKKED